MTVLRISRPRLAVIACVVGLAVAAPSAAFAMAASADTDGLEARLDTYGSSAWYSSGQFTIKNNTSTATDWKLRFTVPAGSFENHASWNIDSEVEGDQVTLTPKQGSLGAGQSEHISFGVSGDGSRDLVLESCDINGADVTGCSAGDGETPEPGDTAAPSVPAALSTHKVDTETVHVMWEHSTDNVGVDHYELERNGEHLRDVPADTRMLNITGHEAGATYEYRVRAVDEAGNASEYSAPSSITMPGAPVEDTESPEIPTDLRAADIAARAMTLKWSPAQDNVGVDHYLVHLFVDGDEVAKRTVSTTEARFTGLLPDTRYTATVLAFDAAGNRSVGAAVTVRTLEESGPVEPGTGTPKDFAATADTYRDGPRTMHRIAMTWTPDATAANRYEVFVDGKRAQTLLVDNAGDYSQKPTDAQTRYVDLGAALGEHTVKIRAQLTDGTWSSFTDAITVR